MTTNQNIIESLKNITYQDFLLSFMNAYEFPTHLTKPAVKQIRDELKNEIIVKGKFWAVDIKDGTNFKGFITRIANHEDISIKKIKYVIVYGETKLVIREIKSRECIEIEYSELADHWDFFNWGFRKSKKKVVEKIVINPMDHLNKIGNFYKELKDHNETIYKENRKCFNTFISRILFCLYAENSGIFKHKLFSITINDCTAPNGEDTGVIINQIFEALNSSDDIAKRKTFLPSLQQFPFIKNKFFNKQLPIFNFNKELRKSLIELKLIDWSEILNKNYGNLLADIIRERKEFKPILEKDILRVIDPLFLYELNESFKKANTVNELTALLERVRNIKIFDPICGFGYFLTLAYKKLSLLEDSIIKKLTLIDSDFSSDKGVTVSQFYGIVGNSFGYCITKLSLCIADVEFNYPSKIGNKCNIRNEKSLLVDWNNICENKGEVYVVGKPPFDSFKSRGGLRKYRFNTIFGEESKFSRLDYCACWFIKGAEYIQESKAKLAFVGTLDISQGESMPYLWERIFEMRLKIKFVYTSFKSSWDAKNVLIVGLTPDINEEKEIYYKEKNKWYCKTVGNISPYLKSGPDQLFYSAASPISVDAPKAIRAGDKDSNKCKVLDEGEIDTIINGNKKSVKLIYKYIDGNNFHYSQFNYCETNEIFVEHFFKCKDENNIIIAVYNNPASKYLPIDFIDNNTIVNGDAIIIPFANMYHFGILSSKMHKAWADMVRNESGDTLTYGLRLGYNAFPWPEATEEDKKIVAKYAEIVYLKRQNYPTLDLHDLYNDKMPEELVMAHYKLDEVVDRLYSEKDLQSNKERSLCLVNQYNMVRNNDE